MKCWPFHSWSDWKTLREGRLAIVGTISVDIGFQPLSNADGNSVNCGAYEIQRRECVWCKMSQLRSTKTRI